MLVAQARVEGLTLVTTDPLVRHTRGWRFCRFEHPSSRAIGRATAAPRVAVAAGSRAERGQAAPPTSCSSSGGAARCTCGTSSSRCGCVRGSRCGSSSTRRPWPRSTASPVVSAAARSRLGPRRGRARGPHGQTRRGRSGGGRPTHRGGGAEGSVQGPVGCFADAFRGRYTARVLERIVPREVVMGSSLFAEVRRRSRAEGRAEGRPSSGGPDGGPSRGDDCRTTSGVPGSRRSASHRESAARRDRYRSLHRPGSPAEVGACRPAALRQRVLSPREKPRPRGRSHRACTPGRARPRAAPGTSRPLFKATLILGAGGRPA